jgi:hypothetical protein
VVLDVIANIAWQNKNRLEQSRDCGARNAVFFFLANDCAVLANNSRILNGDVPSAIRNDPIEQEGIPRAKNGE